MQPALSVATPCHKGVYSHFAVFNEDRMYSNPTQWRRIRKRVLQGGESMRSTARKEGMSRGTLRKVLATESPPGYGGRGNSPDLKRVPFVPPAPKLSRAEVTLCRWKDWLYDLERYPKSDDALASKLSGCTDKSRKKIMATMAHRDGFTSSSIAENLNLSKVTLRHYFSLYDAGGVEALLGRKPRPLKADDESFKKALFALLHEPPSLSGYNRTTWKMDDLRDSLAKKGHIVCKDVIHQAIVKSGFRWRSAKVVLTSKDPKYREKLAHVTEVLSNLRDDERFFSIDEYGPFAIKAKPGRVLAAPGVNPSVQQWQKSKGWLIATAALELSRNRVTHFYSRAKNTKEMIKMAEILLAEYHDAKTLYLSWDAASWHMSKELLAFVRKHDSNTDNSPRIELVPLPASAQFLNVIESVFSGMARAIIHGSDYPSVEAATEAIDRYFAQRNRHYADSPKRAGEKIWGKERTPVIFDTAHNCKDPAYR